MLTDSQPHWSISQIKHLPLPTTFVQASQGDRCSGFTNRLDYIVGNGQFFRLDMDGPVSCRYPPNPVYSNSEQKRQPPPLVQRLYSSAAVSAHSTELEGRGQLIVGFYSVPILSDTKKTERCRRNVVDGHF